MKSNQLIQILSKRVFINDVTQICLIFNSPSHLCHTKLSSFLGLHTNCDKNVNPLPLLDFEFEFVYCDVIYECSLRFPLANYFFKLQSKATV